MTEARDENGRSTHSGTHGELHGDPDRRYLVVALALLVAFFGFEIAFAVIAHSLVLLADAGHMLADIGAILGSLIAVHLAGRPASISHTYGMKRAEILSAAVNGMTLVVVALGITTEAIRRLISSPHVHGSVLVSVAGVGIAVNVLATLVMSRTNHRSLNIQGVLRHIMTDLYGFIGTLVAGVVILATGFVRADAIASLLVVVLVLKAAVALLHPSVQILLEATPEDIDLEEVRQHLIELPEVLAVHDLHVWTLTSSSPVLTAHIVVTDEAITVGQAGQVLDRLQHCLAIHFDVDHSTLQLEAAGHLDHEAPGHP